MNSNLLFYACLIKCVEVFSLIGKKFLNSPNFLLVLFLQFFHSYYKCQQETKGDIALVILYFSINCYVWKQQSLYIPLSPLWTPDLLRLAECSIALPY